MLINTEKIHNNRYISKFLLALMLASSNAMAEWVELPSTAASDTFAVVYVDSKGMSKPGLNAWSMYDYKEPQVALEGEFYRSQKTQLKLDCVNERVGQLYSILYSGQMGMGDVVAKFIYNPEHTWIPVAPNTVGATIWKYFCA